MAVCTSTMTFQVMIPTRTIFVNTRSMDIDTRQVLVTASSRKTPLAVDERSGVYVINSTNMGMMVRRAERADPLVR